MSNHKFQQECRGKLTRMRDRLIDEADRLIDAVPAALLQDGTQSHVPTHTADQATDSLDREVAIVANEQELRADVLAALERLDNDSYGRCQACHGEIGEARLRAVPYARYCVSCAAQEQSHRT